MAKRTAQIISNFIFQSLSPLSDLLFNMSWSLEDCVDPRILRFTDTVQCLPLNQEPDPLPSLFTVCIIGLTDIGGIGQGIAKCYARAGAYAIILLSPNGDDIREFATSLQTQNPGTKVRVIICSAASSENLADSAMLVGGEFDRLDVLVYNEWSTGDPPMPGLMEGKAYDFADCMEGIALGTYLAARSFLPLMMESQGGHKAFIAISDVSTWIDRGPMMSPAYGISRLAQAKVVEHVASRFSKEGVLALALNPGIIKAEAFEPRIPETHFGIDETLCGMVCVHLTRFSQDLQWLSGRYISATWDWCQLMAKKDEIVEKDLLKSNIKLG